MHYSNCIGTKHSLRSVHIKRVLGLGLELGLELWLELGLVLGLVLGLGLGLELWLELGLVLGLELGLALGLKSVLPRVRARTRARARDRCSNCSSIYKLMRTQREMPSSAEDDMPMTTTVNFPLINHQITIRMFLVATPPPDLCTHPRLDCLPTVVRMSVMETT